MNNLKDKMGRYRTRSLFKELAWSSPEEAEGFQPIYTLAEEDDGDLKSAYKIYITCITEYDAAIKLVGSWSHWNKLLNCKPFMEYLEGWRKEQEQKLIADGIKAMVVLATTPDNNGKINVVAAKWLAERGFKKKKLSKKEQSMIEDQHDSILNGLDKSLFKKKE
jgi:hypothetical protein